MVSRFVDQLLLDMELLGKALVADSALNELRIGLGQLRTFLLFASKWQNDVRSRSDESSLMMMGSFLNRLEGSLIQNVKNFHNLCLTASKWQNDVRSRSEENTSSSSSLMMGSFLNRLEDSLIQNGMDFHNLCLTANNEIGKGRWKIDLFKEAHKLYECICSFRQGIAESYITLSDCYTLQSWDQSLQVIDSLQVNVADLLHQSYPKEEPIEVKSIQEKLAIFKNFIRFAQLRGFEPWQLQFLFTRLQVVVVNVAILCHDWTFLPIDNQKKTSRYKEFQPRLRELLQKIKPVGPQVRETYFQILVVLKSSGSSHALTLGTDRHVLGDFVDSLLYNILEALKYRYNYIASPKDQIPMLYRGLSFLRTILTNHLEKIDVLHKKVNQIPMLYGELSFLRTILTNHLEKIDELHKKVKDLIGAAVNEAAIVIFSLLVHELEQGLANEMDIALLNFLEKIKLIKVITSAFIFPRTNEHGFVDFFLENLKELPSCKADSIVYARDQIHQVQEDLSSLRLSFPESVLDRRNQDGKLQSLWSRVAEVAYKTRFVIESLVVEDIPDRNQDGKLQSLWSRVAEVAYKTRFVIESLVVEDIPDRNQDGKLQSLWSHVAEVAYKTRFVIESLVVEDIPDRSTLEFNLIKEEINLIKTEALRVSDNQHSSETQNVTETPSSSLSQGSTPTINKTEVTLDDEANTIIEQLKRESKQLDIISIVGMPGIGKTTLARSVYGHPSVRDIFHARAWCVISQVYEKKNLLLQILGSVDPQFSYVDYSKRNESELEERLRQCLLRRRCLIVLDDVWDIDACNGLVRLFPDDANSSKILLTSRHSDVAKKINPTGEPHHLRLLTEKESLHLLQKKLSNKKSYPLSLGLKIAKNCKGLPLTIVIVAGILANLEKDGWVEIAEKLSLSDLPIIDQCKDMLDVSYKTLPENLRSCLLYFGAFREDEEIPCRQLIWLWMAEGFVQKCETKSLEDVAEDYMNDLIGKNWVIVAKEKSIGGAKTCRIHDLLHEFCVVKAKKEKFLSVLSGRNELFNFYGQHDLQRLCIHSTSEDFEKSRLFCPSIRSLLFASDDSYPFRYRCISSIFHFCKLLKVLNLKRIDLGNTFPSEIALLVELRYLAIYAHSISIPPEVANLSDLETLLLYANSVVLPDDFWNLSKLRVLKSNDCFFRFSRLIPNDLHNLETCSGMFVSLRQLKEIMRKLPNVRRLNCILFVESDECNADCKSIVVMDWLSKLESIHLHLAAKPIEVYNIGFRFPLNIKKLTLSRFHSSIIPKGGELPNLVVLKLNSIYFEGNTWDMNEEWEFPKLKLLEMTSLRIDRWTGSNGVDHFPCLEKLVVQHCGNLEVVPSCLGDIPTLEMIEVHYCGDIAASSFQKIKEEQNDWGNDIQVLIKEW